MADAACSDKPCHEKKWIFQSDKDNQEKAVKRHYKKTKLEFNADTCNGGWNQVAKDSEGNEVKLEDEIA